ncbi:MAG: LacI family transcriptional regulator [Actinobacteria bacterium]|nr:MAG: LacI family transcriptional regulator [Actinomycetota bacterium]
MTTRPARPARLGDVASEAGVHVSTVSRVLNGSDDVSVRPETRTRILETARRLGYRPNAMGRGLKLATTGSLGLLVPSLRNPVNSPIVRGAFDRAWARGFVLVLAEDPGDDHAAEDAYGRLVHEGRIDGLLIQSARLGNPLLDDFAAGIVPCVFLDRRHPGSGRNVFMRDGDAGCLAAEHFLALGHERLALLGGPPELDTVSRRKAGFLERAGDTVAVEEAGLTERGGFEAMTRLVGGPKQPTAVFVANISQAVGALAALREAGLRVPEDISVLCHDDDPICEFLDPPLTAIEMPLVELGVAGVDALIGQIEGEPARDVVLETPPAIVERRSTAQAR